MAISLISNIKSSYVFTEDELGTYVINEARCSGSGNSTSYKLRLTCYFDAIDKVNRTVTVHFTSRLYSASGYAYSGYNVYTKMFVDDVQYGDTVNITSIGAGSNATAAASGTLTLPYDDEGNLTVTAKATLSCSSSASYPPKSATVTCKCTYPTIDSVQAKAYVNKDGEFKQGKAFIYANSKYNKAKGIYVYKNGEWIKNKN